MIDNYYILCYIHNGVGIHVVNRALHSASHVNVFRSLAHKIDCTQKRPDSSTAAQAVRRPRFDRALQ